MKKTNKSFNFSQQTVQYTKIGYQKDGNPRDLMNKEFGD
jgi:hypothetical protein